VFFPRQIYGALHRRNFRRPETGEIGVYRLIIIVVPRPPTAFRAAFSAPISAPIRWQPAPLAFNVAPLLFANGGHRLIDRRFYALPELGVCVGANLGWD
jgi:hypothetical protein